MAQTNSQDQRISSIFKPARSPVNSNSKAVFIPPPRNVREGFSMSLRASKRPWSPDEFRPNAAQNLHGVGFDGGLASAHSKPCTFNSPRFFNVRSI
jgi:hypothetical protein